MRNAAIHNALTFNHPEDTKVNVKHFLSRNPAPPVQDGDEDSFMNDVEEGMLNENYNGGDWC